jgi:acetyl esterase/lipase
MMSESKDGSSRVEIWTSGLPEKVPDGLMEACIDRADDLGQPDRNMTGITAPFLEVVRPKKANGSALLIMPGGGYRRLAWDKEGLEIAAWFAARGVTSFVLAYRLPRDGWPSGLAAPLADAQRAIRLIRSQAQIWGIDPLRIAALGFSAGAHLCANLATQFAKPTCSPRDAIDAVSARPDLAATIYPVVDLQRYAASLFGSTLPPPAMLADHSPHCNVPSDAPPHFIVHAEDDQYVAPEDSLALRAALVAQQVTVETHLFSAGNHSFGLFRTPGLPVAVWPDSLLTFGRLIGWID